MTADTNASLRKLHSLSKNINEASDKLTAQLSAIETELNNLKLGVAAWVDIRNQDSEDGFVHVDTLGYSKLNGKWGLLLGGYIDGAGPDEYNETIFLREATRDMRILAASFIDDLLSKLVERTEQTTEKIINKAGELKGIATALSKGRT